VAAGVHQVRHHPLADLPAGDALAERADAADDLDTPRTKGGRPGSARPLADVDVEMVESGGEDVEDDLARSGLGSGRSLSCSTSEPPNSSNTTAFKPGPPTRTTE
jgi:hypothetical protein